MNDDNRILLLSDQLRALARYETDFSEFNGFSCYCDDIFDVFKFQEEYQFTLDDLHEALINLISKNPTVMEFGDYWFFPLLQLKSAFGKDHLRRNDYEKQYEDNPAPDCVRDLPVTKEYVFNDVWNWLEERWIIGDDDERLTDDPAIFTVLQTVEQYLAECEKPVTERFFTDGQKEKFLKTFESFDRINHSSELEMTLFRQFTDELCEKDSVEALFLKGYGCFQGNPFPFDWKTALKCLNRLYELTDDSECANCLGIMYYYGLSTDGVPEYEKAFPLFSYAAANGYQDAVNRLGDLYRYGYACKLSPSTARNLYGIVYADCLPKFIDGENKNFATTALRKGDTFLMGIDEPVDPEEAYFYYLQADLAQRRLMKESDYFGNLFEAIAICKALHEAKELLGPDYFQEYTESEQPWLIYSILEDNNRATICLEEQNNEVTSIIVKRVPVRKGKYVSPVFVTEPQLDWCELTREIIYQAVNASTTIKSEDVPVSVDYAEWNQAEQRIEFYFNDIPIGWISCDRYRLYGPKKEPPTGRLLHIVSVRFHPEGRCFDFLCEDETIHPGDQVSVTIGNREKHAEVLSVFTKYESEVGVPVDRYMKVNKTAYGD